MDLQSFIASGLLEAYALDQCSAEERATVERMLAQHPELRDELQQIEQALEQYALAQAVVPPAGLKDQIMKKIEENTPESSSPSPEPKGGKISLMFLTAAAAAILMGVLWMRATRENNRLQEENLQIRQQADDCQRKQKRTDVLEKQVALLRDRDTKMIVISGGKSTTAVYYNDLRREVALDLSGVPAPSPGKYLQFWAMVDGEAFPKSMGMVATQADGSWQTFDYMENIKGFAVSEEDNPQGSERPRMVLMTPI